MPALHNWRASKFLYDNLVAHWGKPCYVQIDNSTEFVGSISLLCKGLGIVHHHITIGNRKANGQVEQMIRTLKDCIWHGLMREPRTFWINHLPLTLFPLMYDSKLDDGHHAISFNYGLSTVITKHGHPRTALPAQSASSGRGRCLCHQS